MRELPRREATHPATLTVQETTDSFYGGRRVCTPELGVRRALRMVARDEGETGQLESVGECV